MDFDEAVFLEDSIQLEEQAAKKSEAELKAEKEEADAKGR